ELERDKAGQRQVGTGQRESMILVVIDPLPAERREALREGLAAALGDVRMAVGDHGAMTALMAASIRHLEAGPKGVDAEVLAENLEFLRWLNDDHFVFLGARDYDYPRSGDG